MADISTAVVAESQGRRTHAGDDERLPSTSVCDPDELDGSASKWQKVQKKMQGVLVWKKATKPLDPEPSDKGEAVNSGSLLSYLTCEQLTGSTRDSDVPAKRQPTSPVLDPVEQAALRLGGVASPASSYASFAGGRRVYRRRVHRLGDELSERHSTRHWRQGCPARATPNPAPLPPLGDSSSAKQLRAAHALPFGSPLGAPISRATPAEDHWLWDYSALLAHPSSSSRSPQRAPHHGSWFAPGILGGHGCVRPKERQHPMLSRLAQLENEDGAASEDPDDTSGASQEAPTDRGMTHLSRRLENLRWKELRRGPWTDQPEPLPEFFNLQQAKEVPHPHHFVELSARQRRQDDMGAGSRHVDDFAHIVWLVDPDHGQKLPPESFVPLMFWLGFTKQRRAAMLVFEMAFGRGNVAPSKIVQLAAYCDVQIRLAEGFKWLARRQSVDQLCEYITDQNRLREWFSSMNCDIKGEVDITEIQKMLARMEVTTDKKVLFRFLEHFASVYQEGLTQPTSEDIHSPNRARSRKETAQLNSNQKSNSPTQGNSTDTLKSGASPSTARFATERTRFGFHFLGALLCRCVVTWSIARVLDLLDPPTHAAGSKSARLDAHANDNEDVEAKFARRWAEVHRRIVVSLLVNHRYWGREGKMVLAALSQSALFSQELSPEQWLALFQRVRAQGMASTFPEGDEFDDPEFLKKKASCAVDSPDI